MLVRNLDLGCWLFISGQAPLAEILLQNDKVELGEKYNMRISSRFQPLVAKTAHYHFPLPTSEQNRRYSNVRHKHPPEGVPSLEPPKDKKDPTSLSKSSERQTPLLTKLRQPVQEGMARLRPGVAYSVSRLEEWFLLLDTSRSGEVTVRKLILGMMKHQDRCGNEPEPPPHPPGNLAPQALAPKPFRRSWTSYSC